MGAELESSGCEHKFHKDCVTPWFFQKMKHACPLCQKPTSVQKRHVLLLVLTVAYHSLTGYLFTGVKLVHTIFWPWYFVILFWLNRTLQRARLRYLWNQYHFFRTPPDVVNAKLYKNRRG